MEFSLNLFHKFSRFPLIRSASSVDFFQPKLSRARDILSLTRFDICQLWCLEIVQAREAVRWLMMTMTSCRDSSEKLIQFYGKVRLLTVFNRTKSNVFGGWAKKIPRLALVVKHKLIAAIGLWVELASFPSLKRYRCGRPLQIQVKPALLVELRYNNWLDRDKSHTQNASDWNDHARRNVNDIIDFALRAQLSSIPMQEENRRHCRHRSSCIIIVN